MICFFLKVGRKSHEDTSKELESQERIRITMCYMYLDKKKINYEQSLNREKICIF